jgi:8-oxo-dGTP pyrophosphatase MutT (NUDIX family)
LRCGNDDPRPGGAHLTLHREVACAILIDPQGRYLLQRRDNDPNIIYPGRIGLFGGHREGGETFLECVCREVHEETGYLATPKEFELLGSYSVPDREIPEATVVGHYYLLRNGPVDFLNVTEGSLIIVVGAELDSLALEFAPSATTAFGMLLELE